MQSNCKLSHEHPFIERSVEGKMNKKLLLTFACAIGFGTSALAEEYRTADNVFKSCVKFEYDSNKGAEKSPEKTKLVLEHINTSLNTTGGCPASIQLSNQESTTTIPLTQAELSAKGHNCYYTRITGINYAGWPFLDSISCYKN